MNVVKGWVKKTKEKEKQALHSHKGTKAVTGAVPFQKVHVCT